MKKLLLLWIFSGSLHSFSQVVDTTQPLREFSTIRLDYGINSSELFTGQAIARGAVIHRTSDTLRAIVLVTLSPNGIAHSRMGFVVISEGKRPVYLDCNKRALKLPQVGWNYQVIDPNYKKL